MTLGQKNTNMKVDIRPILINHLFEMGLKNRSRTYRIIFKMGLKMGWKTHIGDQKALSLRTIHLGDRSAIVVLRNINQDEPTNFLLCQVGIRLNSHSLCIIKEDINV